MSTISLEKTLFEVSQEEQTEIRNIAGEDGVVTEQEVVLQQGFKVRVYATLTGTQDAATNTTTITTTQLCYEVECGEKGEGFTLSPFNCNYFLYYGNRIHTSIGIDSFNNNYLLDSKSSASSNDKVIAPGQRKVIVEEYTNNSIQLYHSFEGNRDAVLVDLYYGFSLKGIVGEGNGYYEDEIRNVNIPLPAINRGTPLITADNFTDEENPTITYNAVNPLFITSDNELSSGATLDVLQAAISLDGETIDIDYRDISPDDTSYTFNFSDAEREMLRVKAQGSDTVPVYFLTRTVRSYESLKTSRPEEVYETISIDIVNSTQRTFTIVGCNPQLNPTVKDIKEETLALTGDENTFVRYESMAEYAINATASKHATIVSQSVQCGSKIITDLPYGVIDDTESGTFIFSVVDSRNMGAVSTVTKKLVEYVKPTCYQKVGIELSGETDANIKVTVNGNYFNGSFGAADNELRLEVRHTDDNGTMGEWTVLTGSPTFNDNGYELDATFSGFNYGKAYTFQCRAIDKLNIVQSSQYVIRLLPVFDWSETDFNFNVPVNINAEDLSMHGETIIRHNAEANNTVLSASGGHIYIRPKGTNNTSGETIIYPDGSITFGGSVDFDTFTIEGNTLADYIVETGEEAMGSNGTWYWAKWASGKAECWGCRNFGNMAVTTAWGNLYRSAILTQDLPEDVFKTTPDVITMNIVNANFGGWLCKHENLAPSAVTTGSFIFVRPASATISPTYIGFHVIGLWK